jgi:hypothetical protein
MCSLALRLALLSILIGAGVSAAQPNQRHTVSHHCIGPIAAASLDSFEVSEKLVAMFEAEDFGNLDAALSCLLTSPVKLQSGHSGASAAYGFFRQQMPAPGLKAIDASRVASWSSSRPNSLFAEFATLRLQYASAWRVRGGKAAAQVPEQNMRQFVSGIESTRRALLAASGQLKQTVLWHQLWLATVQDGPQSQQEWSHAFIEGIKKWPEFFDFYEAAISRTIPRWGGTWLETDLFAEKWAAATAKTEGDSLYARLYLHLFWYGTDPLSVRANWPRMKRSLADLVKRYPTALHINLAASLACLHSDRGAYKEFMSEIPALMPNAWFDGADFHSCELRLSR